MTVVRKGDQMYTQNYFGFLVENENKKIHTKLARHTPRTLTTISVLTALHINIFQ